MWREQRLKISRQLEYTIIMFYPRLSGGSLAVKRRLRNSQVYSIPIRQGMAVTFDNRELVHRMEKLSFAVDSSKRESSKGVISSPAERKILSFFVVNPKTQITDTSQIEVNQRFFLFHSICSHCSNEVVLLVLGYLLSEDEDEVQFQRFCKTRSQMVFLPSGDAPNGGSDTDDRVAMRPMRVERMRKSTIATKTEREDYPPFMRFFVLKQPNNNINERRPRVLHVKRCYLKKVMEFGPPSLVFNLQLVKKQKAGRKKKQKNKHGTAFVCGF